MLRLISTRGAKRFTATPFLQFHQTHLNYGRNILESCRAKALPWHRCITTESSENRTVTPILIEEETLPDYVANDFYPVKIGQTFHDSYKVVGKLGYGTASTVWLCQDLSQPKQYYALKIYNNNPRRAQRELPIYHHLRQLQSEHDGKQFVRALIESFDVQGPHGTHICLVHELKGISLGQLRDRLPDKLFNVELVRYGLRSILVALEYLHKDAEVIHTDLQPNNLLMGVREDDSAVAQFLEQEASEPSHFKDVDHRRIYRTRPMALTTGDPSLSDFSEARFGKEKNTSLIMPDALRAPEVILGMEWSYPVDIWGFGMVIWDLFEPKLLFKPRDENGRYSEEHQLAKMVAIMGAPPRDFLQRSEKCAKYWDADGNWKGSVPIPEISFETMERRLSGEEKVNFLKFIRKMIQWRPEDRSDCDGVWNDGWLLEDLIESGDIRREDLESASA